MGANFILAEGLKIEFFFLPLSGRESSFRCKLFVNLVYTFTLPIHPST